MKYKRCCICRLLLPPQALVKVENTKNAPWYLHGEYVCRSEKKCDERREKNQGKES
jgi:hypothetical protein